ncbi:hypothetical protein PIN31009_05562 [Pandoraea iniqua]|uniref:crossover junction endodeoxyribonuclease RuvC n=1 Tax=Pandoraea iniqua TaxID=2508288 RepID=UPI001242E5A6|nr:crossover junction endodeoxyribonuclease RuvC [Pandoraea iniqua]VVE59509.1 hypothetical protein PIN31009_05562 [Pandoraea iniqua]
MTLFDEMPRVCAQTQTVDAPDEFPPLASAPAFETRRSILALDLGTKLGWATVDRNGVVRSGSILCSTSIGSSTVAGQRWNKFRAHLNQMCTTVGDIDAVYFEDVKNHGPGQIIAAHVYGGFLAHLEHWCTGRNIEMTGVGVGQVKKAWTGAGNAKKPDMIAAAQARGFRPKDDNEADALAILSLAITRENAR